MADPKKPYALSVNNTNYRLMLNDTVYSTPQLAAALGMTKGTEQTNYNGIGGLKDLRKSYAIARVTATGKDSAGKRKTFLLWCATSKVQTALGVLPTLTIKGYNISSASARLTTRFR